MTAGYDDGDLTKTTAKYSSPIRYISKITYTGKDSSRKWIHTTKMERANRVRVKVQSFGGVSRTGYFTVYLKNGTQYRYTVIEYGLKYYNK